MRFFLSSAIPVPVDADPAVVAATMNPAMSSWVALHDRVGFRPGQSVLVIGATGNAGSMAVKVARVMGAERVVAAGRQVGGVGGMEITLGGHLFRHNALRISGSGFGSVPLGSAELPRLAALVGSGELTVAPRRVDLADVEAAWAHQDDRGERAVIVP